MSLSTIADIERAIRSLTPREVEELYAWIEEHYSQSIDNRVEADLAAGRLDKAMHRALEDERKGNVKPL